MTKPWKIEEESMDFIDKNVELNNFTRDEIPIVKRIIHATGDLAIAEDIIISDDAIKSGIQALKKGRSVITDVNMVKTGISKKQIDKLGGDVFCRIDKDEIHKKAKNEEETRAALAMKSFGDFINNQVIAIGNAPTALFAVLEMIEKTKINPALVVGVPVGFVGAKESKEALEKSHVPYITVRGYKGGSPIACAAINALLKFIFSPTN